MTQHSASEEDKLWTTAELADFLGYQRSTVIRMVSQEPARLPPRVGHLAKPRWVPSICWEWAKKGSLGDAPALPRPARKRGRPRRVVSPAS